MVVLPGALGINRRSGETGRRNRVSRSLGPRRLFNPLKVPAPPLPPVIAINTDDILGTVIYTTGKRLEALYAQSSDPTAQHAGRYLWPENMRLERSNNNWIKGDVFTLHWENGLFSLGWILALTAAIGRGARRRLVRSETLGDLDCPLTWYKRELRATF